MLGYEFVTEGALFPSAPALARHAETLTRYPRKARTTNALERFEERGKRWGKSALAARPPALAPWEKAKKTVDTMVGNGASSAHYEDKKGNFCVCWAAGRTTHRHHCPG